MDHSEEVSARKSKEKIERERERERKEGFMVSHSESLGKLGKKACVAK